MQILQSDGSRSGRKYNLARSYCNSVRISIGYAIIFQQDGRTHSRIDIITQQPLDKLTMALKALELLQRVSYTVPNVREKLHFRWPEMQF